MWVIKKIRSRYFTRQPMERKEDISLYLIVGETQRRLRKRSSAPTPVTLRNEGEALTLTVCLRLSGTPWLLRGNWAYVISGLTRCASYSLMKIVLAKVRTGLSSRWRWSSTTAQLIARLPQTLLKVPTMGCFRPGEIDDAFGSQIRKTLLFTSAK